MCECCIFWWRTRDSVTLLVLLERKRKRAVKGWYAIFLTFYDNEERKINSFSCSFQLMWSPFVFKFKMKWWKLYWTSNFWFYEDRIWHVSHVVATNKHLVLWGNLYRFQQWNQDSKNILILFCPWIQQYKAIKQHIWNRHNRATRCID